MISNKYPRKRCFYISIFYGDLVYLLEIASEIIARTFS